MESSFRIQVHVASKIKSAMSLSRRLFHFEKCSLFLTVSFHSFELPGFPFFDFFL